MRGIEIQRMSAKRFAPFGDLIDFERATNFSINNGNCDRYHALAVAEALGPGGHVNISLGRARPYALPLHLELMERHPLGSQAFIPLGPVSFLVVVAPDSGGRPGDPLAFLTHPGQGVNYRPNIWHAVLTPLGEETDFVIVDRIGEGQNLEEYAFKEPYIIDFSIE